MSCPPPIVPSLTRPRLRSAQFGGNHYGTSKATIEEQTAKGKVVVLDIEMEGVKQIKATEFPARYVFIAPPSEEELERRLRGRATDSEESIQKRLAQARNELAYSRTPGVHDKIIVNRVRYVGWCRGSRKLTPVAGSGGGIQGAGRVCLCARVIKQAMCIPRCLDFARALCYNFNPEPIFRRLLDHFFLDGYQEPIVGPISRSLGFDISRSFSPRQIRRKPSPQIPLLNSRQSQPRGIPSFPKHAQKPLPLRPSTDGHAVAAVCPRIVSQLIRRIAHKIPPGSTTTHAVNPLVKQPQILESIVT